MKYVGKGSALLNLLCATLLFFFQSWLTPRLAAESLLHQCVDLRGSGRGRLRQSAKVGKDPSASSRIIYIL